MKEPTVQELQDQLRILEEEYNSLHDAYHRDVATSASTYFANSYKYIEMERAMFREKSAAKDAKIKELMKVVHEQWKRLFLLGEHIGKRR